MSEIPHQIETKERQKCKPTTAHSIKPDKNETPAKMRATKCNKATFICRLFRIKIEHEMKMEVGDRKQTEIIKMFKTKM